MPGEGAGPSLLGKDPLPCRFQAVYRFVNLLRILPELTEDAQPFIGQILARIELEELCTVLPLSRLCLRPPKRSGLVLGFAATPVEEIEPGVQRLAQAIEEAMKGTVKEENV